MHSSKNSGFTLVELAIVIVIIGLIVGGITGGQLLVKQAQMRAIVTESNQVLAAVNAFKLEYNGLPGDITNGRSYWTSCGASDAICNGDGDKAIEITVKAGTQQPEAYIAWWQLSAAGIFPGTYTIPGSGAGSVVGTLDTVIPRSKFPGAGITIGYDTTASNLTSADNTETDLNLLKNIILFAGTVSGQISNQTLLSAPQAVSIDNKADDGNPTTGVVRAVGQADGSADSCNSSSAYTLASTNTTPCAIAFTM